MESKNFTFVIKIFLLFYLETWQKVSAHKCKFTNTCIYSRSSKHLFIIWDNGSALFGQNLVLCEHCLIFAWSSVMKMWQTKLECGMKLWDWCLCFLQSLLSSNSWFYFFPALHDSSLDSMVPATAIFCKLFPATGVDACEFQAPLVNILET